MPRISASLPRLRSSRPRAPRSCSHPAILRCRMHSGLVGLATLLPSHKRHALHAVNPTPHRRMYSELISPGASPHIPPALMTRTHHPLSHPPPSPQDVLGADQPGHRHRRPPRLQDHRRQAHAQVGRGGGGSLRARRAACRPQLLLLPPRLPTPRLSTSAPLVPCAHEHPSPRRLEGGAALDRGQALTTCIRRPPTPPMHAPPQRQEGGAAPD